MENGGKLKRKMNGLNEKSKCRKERQFGMEWGGGMAAENAREAVPIWEELPM